MNPSGEIPSNPPLVWIVLRWQGLSRLLEQPFIFDDKKSVAQALKEAEKEVGGAITIAGFARYALGEGIERPDTDFGGEVAAAAGLN